MICDSRSFDDIIVKNNFNKTLEMNNQTDLDNVNNNYLKFDSMEHYTPLSLAIKIFAVLCQMKIPLWM